ncbi:sugar phosphate isomerase/epimerase family protein [Rhizobium puerariae]|uniref:Sugar phosphate isomerase/epimerase family protein n=1 Tax=Rhizobium puerariae TaxID=1585791 RepID=A0ABV6AJX9_9HYPH
MDTCITVWQWPDDERWYDEGIKRSLRLISEAGFTHINWNPDSGNSYMLSDAEIAFTAEMVRASGLKVKSVHGTNGRNPISEVQWRKDRRLGRETRRDILSPHEWQRQSGVELVRNRVDLAAAFGSPDIVMHIDITDDVFRSTDAEEVFFTPLWASLEELQPYCLKKGVKIAAETLFCASSESFLLLYDRLFDRFPEEFIGLCLDTGHWEMIDPGACTVLEQFGDRLITTHINDNLGATDDHLLPFDGRIDWETVTRLIAGTRYEPPLNLETHIDRYSMPEAAFYRRAHKVAIRLEKLIAAYRMNDFNAERPEQVHSVA